MKEARARIKINKLLEASGWRFFDSDKGHANISLENNVKLSHDDFERYGNDFEKFKNGFVDFLLLDENNFPFVVLEAKSEDNDPLIGKEQARRYAQSQNVRFIILSNGNLHYLWDLERGNPSIISAFPTYESLKYSESFKPSLSALSNEVVGNDYIALTQKPNYKDDPRWLSNPNKYISDENLKFLRPYQVSAIHSLQKSAEKGNDRYLFEMATGTGKTLISCGIIKLFLKTGNAKRILFLVDRLELEDQAWRNFSRYLKNDFTCVIYKENKGDWKKAEVVVSTVQSLSFNNKYKHCFSPTDFNLIISDEAHRSIGGNSRAVFEYFVGYKLGLTATPKDYLKNIDKISETDPRAWERRQLYDTYNTFGCSSGEPTFRYSLLDGVKDKYLINPIIADARSQITTQLLSDKGYSLEIENEEGKKEEQTFFLRDFERKFFSQKTNQIFCKTFIENALKDPVSGEIGKSICFCVSQNHASKITEILNQFAEELWPGKYNSDFAVQITSNISDSQQFTINFSNNNLNGHTKWLDGYKSSKTRVCVTVGMMTTGYDCQDILNLLLMRPIFSPTDFIQIKGRGTRKHTFAYKENESSNTTYEKEHFKLFDFFATCEYFESKFDYDQILKIELPSDSNDGGGDKAKKEEVSIFNVDPLETFSEKVVGSSGMKVDWKFFDKFETTIKNDLIIKEKYSQGDIEGIEEYIKSEIFEKPHNYFNLDKLRQAVKADRRIALKEFIEKIFGGISKLKSKDELLDDEFEKFLTIYKPESKYVLPIKNFLKAYITDHEIRDIVESKEYSRLATNPKVTMEDFKQLNGYREHVPNYVKDYVSINTFM
ncbi:HsdR Type I site-specific restriction-modification system, R (restriction) subunit and related helicases [Candidatus Methylopumilus planktonicus]|uniref:DEAD/DEAH box helicase family protein n=1 Tax=Candidatus Methylopumilus planktonicus TaxID=1581557 RepID=UPI003BEF225E